MSGSIYKIDDMLNRDIVYFEGAAKKAGWKPVTPDDFSRNHPQKVCPDALENLSLVPYCFDFESKQIIFANGVDPIRAGQATFHYAYLREQASGFLQVPIEHFPAKVPDDTPIPTILFSPGRCGSTLLSKILATTNVTSISEPDFYTQVAIHAALRNSKKAPIDYGALHMLSHAGRSLLMPFVKRNAISFVLKMRSHANCAPAHIISSFSATPKTIFLIRNFRGWCESSMRAFGHPLDRNFNIFLDGLHALKWLRGNTDCLVLRYEDLTSNTNRVIQQLEAFLQVTSNPADIDTILNTDSQSGTALARDQLGPGLSAESIDAIHKLWHSKAPRVLLEELNLNDL